MSGDDWTRVIEKGVEHHMKFEELLKKATLWYVCLLVILTVVSVTLVNLWWNVVVGPIIADAYGVHFGNVTEGYTLWSSLFYTGTLCIMLGWILVFLKRVEWPVDRKFILSLLPYIVLGSVMRVMEDAGTVRPPLSILVISPVIYFVLTAMVVAVIVALTKLKWRRNRQLMFLGIIGAIVLYWALWALLGGQTWACENCNLVLGACSIVVAISIMFLHFTKKFVNAEHFMTATAHMLDATATFIGVQYLGYYEKHPLPSMLIERMSAWVMFPLKVGMLGFVFFSLEHIREETDNDLYYILWLAVIVLGLAPGVRDILRMCLGV